MVKRTSAENPRVMIGKPMVFPARFPRKSLLRPCVFVPGSLPTLRGLDIPRQDEAGRCFLVQLEPWIKLWQPPHEQWKTWKIVLGKRHR
jgi:hypothetical protein